MGLQSALPCTSNGLLETMLSRPYFFSSEYPVASSSSRHCPQPYRTPPRCRVLLHSSGCQASSPCRAQRRSMAEPDQATIQRAIVIAQTATNDNLDQQTKEILALAVRALWRRIQSQPDTYLLTSLEARVFNYHQSLFRENDLARRTWARYWSNTHGIDGVNGH